MKNLRFLTVLALVAFAFAACNKLDDQTPARGDSGVMLKSAVISPCGEPVSYALMVGTVENHPVVGWLTISNDNDYLNLSLTTDFGFQPIADNVEIAFYNTLPATRPDVNGFHYKYTVTEGNTFSVHIPLNAVYIEDLGGFSSIACNQPIFILMHSDVYLQVWPDPTKIAESGWVGFNLGPDGLWWKWMTHTICCVPECTGETAWSAGMRYQRTNWATFSAYNGEAKTETLFAGQTMEAGTVYFTPNGDNVDINIQLNEGWSLQDVMEPVKIQGYIATPVTKPVPGLFVTYRGDDLSVTVPKYNFYGIHVDVQLCK